MKFVPKLIHDDCLVVLKDTDKFFSNHPVHLTFLDPPFNQNKQYRNFNDNMEVYDYWSLISDVCKKIFQVTVDGGAIYFMQREKNTEFVLRCLRRTGWTFQNLICWKKKTSAVPSTKRYGKQHQIIVYATKGPTPYTFHRLKIDPPLPPNYKKPRVGGLYLTDVWDDIRELTSGYLAGGEVLRDNDGVRVHNQQSPIALLTRIILSSSQVNDLVLDPFAGTSTTLVVAQQLNRRSIGIEIDEANIRASEFRIKRLREIDLVYRYHGDYSYTEKLPKIWS